MAAAFSHLEPAATRDTGCVVVAMLYSIVKERSADETIQGRKIPIRHSPAKGQKWPVVVVASLATCLINRLEWRSAEFPEYFQQRRRGCCFEPRLVERPSVAAPVSIDVGADAGAAFSPDAGWRD